MHLYGNDDVGQTAKLVHIGVVRSIHECDVGMAIRNVDGTTK